MNIVYASDNNYADIMGVSIVSLFESCRDCEEINVFILDDGISEENREKLLSVGEKYGRSIRSISVENIEVPDSVLSNRWSKSAFTRLYLKRLLPEGTDRILYLDCDVLVLESLEQLYRMDMDGCAAAGVRDCVGEKYLSNIGLERGDIYCNSGVLLIDIDKWDEDEFMRFFSGNAAIRYPDQDIINGVCSRKMRALPLRYNCLTVLFDFSYRDMLIFRDPPDYYPEDEVREAVKSPAIVHFTSSFLSLRPWIEGCMHTYGGRWLDFKAMSPWADVPLRKDSRSGMKKFAVRVYRALPKDLALNMAGFLHSKLLPMLGRKRK